MVDAVVSPGKTKNFIKMESTQITSMFGTFNVTIEKNKSITVAKENQSASFKIGDTAEYDSYNLSYLGEIVSITEKTVTIKPQHSSGTRRLKIAEFAWRNYNFNLAETLADNLATSYTI